MKAVWLLLALAGLLQAQTPAKRPQSEAKSVGKSDDWQKRKDCAEQAEKVVLEFRARSVANGGHGEMDWQNHYSPKYNRCYLVLQYFTGTKDGGGTEVPMFSGVLVDAHERSTLAWSASGPGPTDGVCKVEDSDEKFTCIQVDRYIAEHMKN